MRKQTLKIGLAAAALVVGVGLITWSLTRPNPLRQGRAPKEHFFYDVNDGELFAASAGEIPPIEAPSGGEGVRAYVYACGRCTEARLQIGYLERFEPQAARAMELRDDPRLDEGELLRLQQMIRGGTRVASPPEPGSSPEWISFEDAKAQHLTQAYREMCDDGLARLCAPRDLR